MERTAKIEEHGLSAPKHVVQLLAHAAAKLG